MPGCSIGGCTEAQQHPFDEHVLAFHEQLEGQPIGARTRHTSVHSLERYARPGVDTVAQHFAARAPAVRRR
ncbi:hypothetical protein [Streptomyces sp. NPDC048516]|uniref:hypothetical protein n=1 Tax=Streptomyces sp. NPDC048516 TaxID=3365565 RepID=UPI003718F579